MGKTNKFEVLSKVKEFLIRGKHEKPGTVRQHGLFRVIFYLLMPLVTKRQFTLFFKTGPIKHRHCMVNYFIDNSNNILLKEIKKFRSHWFAKFPREQRSLSTDDCIRNTNTIAQKSPVSGTETSHS